MIRVRHEAEEQLRTAKLKLTYKYSCGLNIASGPFCENNDEHAQVPKCKGCRSCRHVCRHMRAESQH